MDIARAHKQVDQYQELKRDIGRLSQCRKVAGMPRIIEDLGAIGRILDNGTENYRWKTTAIHAEDLLVENS